MNFKISDKVVCVDASPGSPQGPQQYRGVIILVKNQTYVVTGTTKCPVSGVGGVTLAGFDLGTSKLGPNGLRATRFRLLSEVQAENAALRSKNVLSIVVSKNNQLSKCAKN